MTKISVIVPIYNNEQYLNDCVQSIINQSFKDLEIILVNNRSTDRSLEIMNNLAEQDQRVRTVTIKHGSMGSAKSLGVAMATGDFINFVHANDYLGSSNLQNLINCQSKYDSDIAASTYFRINEEGTFYFYVNNDDPGQQSLEGIFTPQEWIHRETGISANMTDLFMQDFNKIIKRSLFKNVMFPAMDVCADNYTMWKLYLLADKISYVNIGDYCYRMLPSKPETNQEIFQRNFAELKSLEERMAIYDLIDFDASFLNDNYKAGLIALRDSALNAGNYHYYKDCCFKLDMIKKYTENDGVN